MTVGVAYSHTPAGAAALRRAVTEAALRETGVVALVVVDTAEHATDETALAATRAAVAESLTAAGAPADLDWRLQVAPTRGAIAEALVELAIAVQAQVLVIGTRRRSPVGKFILGSTVQRVLLDAPMPVLVVKPSVPD